MFLTSPVHGPHTDGHLDIGVVQAGLPHGGSLPGEAKPASSVKQASKSLGKRRASRGQLASHGLAP